MKTHLDLTLSVIIVSFNTSKLTLQSIEAVLAELLSEDSLRDQSEIIVVDNHSIDGSVGALKKIVNSYSSKINFQLILNSENRGFASANNLAIKQARGHFIFLLNSDTILQQGCLSKMIRTLIKYPVNNLTSALSSHKGQLDRLGILAATLLNPDGSIQHQGGRLPNLLTVTSQMLFLDDLPFIGKLFPSSQETGRAARSLITTDDGQVRQKGWVGGTAIMIRREVINEVGLLDENIFMYGEDMEYCLRSHHKHWDIAIDPNAKVIHLGSASSSSHQALLGEIKTYLYIWAKHMPHWQRRFLKLILWMGINLRLLIFGWFKQDLTKVKTYQEALTLLD